MSARTQIRDLMRHALAQGWTIRRTAGAHWLWLAPSGARVVSGSTPSDHRAHLNLRADLKRAGLRLGLPAGPTGRDDTKGTTP